jgi:hypothetical protein
VLKYRLYAIEKIISRTVSYVLVTGLVAGVYLGCVALLGNLLGVVQQVLAPAHVSLWLRDPAGGRER